ncbi:MAG: gliding motility-associated-like protein [Polaribacter sp.]|jgi:gliding motility-associated-like protein
MCSATDSRIFSDFTKACSSRTAAFSLCILLPFSSLAQPTYNLVGNIEVDDCEGFFQDSDAGLNGEDYSHGEDYIFTICVPNAISIDMTFFNFGTEGCCDIMTFYDGPNVSSPQIGPAYSGLDLPPTITATSGCLTIHWESDVFGVSSEGWYAYWEVEVEEPEPPIITFDPVAPTCSTEVIVMEFDTPIPCDSVYTGAFTLTGGHSISNITPLNCVGGEGTNFELTMSPGLDESMVYDLDFIYHYSDDCDNEFILEVEGSFEVNDCPIEVEVLEESLIVCEDDCVEIWAEASGGDPNTYNYAWNNGLPNSPGPHLVCPVTSTTYTVTVSDAGPATPASDQTTITVIAPPIVDPIPDVCQNTGSIALTANPAGGTWSGTHVPDPDPIFRPDSGVGTPWTTYTDLNGCSDSVQSEVYQIWAGYDQSACPGSASFQLTNGYPAGGTWSGPFTTPSGIFDPSTPGAYNITYTTADGCTDIKVVRVDDITLPADMIICESDPLFYFSVTPFGGTWSGTGVANWYWGSYDPAAAGPGTHTITYTLNGCADTFEVTVTEIDAGSNYVICPEEPAIQLTGTPAGGNWTGIGVSPTGLYEPTIAPNLTNDTLIYSVGGCTDKRIIYVQQTTVQWTNLEFCLYDNPLQLDWEEIHRYPGGGTWTGPGTDNIGDGNFTPADAGGGTHTLYYEANTCIDSTVMIVHENTMFDTSICELGNPIQMAALPAGGTWSGDGIIDLSGMFDPEVVGLGQHYVYYQSPTSCWDSCLVDVYQLEPAIILGLENTYCFIDSAIALIGTPAGGLFSGTGMTDTIFNPSLAGEGIHEIAYGQGAAGCEVHTDILVSVSAPITTDVFGNGEAVCKGDAITISVEATGGDGSFFTYTWDPNVSSFAMQELYPDVSTAYAITTSDGCSDPANDTINLFVYEPHSAIVETSAILCYGNTGFITVEGDPPAPVLYDYQWNSNPPNYTNTIYGPAATTYGVTITEIESGCQFDTSITIPFYPNVTAFFTPNPNGGCLSEADPVAEFLDLSQGAVTGTWDFGDGFTEDYIFGQYPIHEYGDTGVYEVVLYVENDLGTCSDRYTFELCIQPEFTLWIPNSFTPDGDGLNDFFEIVSSGIVEFELLISSSWGTKIHRMNSIDDPPWDGTYKGNPVQQDRYIYEVVAKGNHLGGIKFHKGSGYIHVIRKGE